MRSQGHQWPQLGPPVAGAFALEEAKPVGGGQQVQPAGAVVLWDQGQQGQRRQHWHRVTISACRPSAYTPRTTGRPVVPPGASCSSPCSCRCQQHNPLALAHVPQRCILPDAPLVGHAGEPTLSLELSQGRAAVAMGHIEMCEASVMGVEIRGAAIAAGRCCTAPIFNRRRRMN